MKTLGRFSCAVMVFAGIGCAHAPTSYMGDVAGTKPEKMPEMRMVTGSRIPQRVDARGEFPATVSPVHIISRGELDATGKTNTAVALRALEPGAR
jgi:hypothetical protein